MKLHSVESAAQFLGGISPSTIRAWLSSGKLRRVKVGRRTFVYESDLAALIEPENREEIVPANSSVRQNGAGRAAVLPPQHLKKDAKP